MNFQDLLTKIRSIDESDNTPTSPTDTMLTGSQAIGGDPTDDFIKDVSATECGGMMNQMSPQKQQDNVTMNVSMNGSGTGGIRDLMSILKNIEQSDNKDIGVVFGADEDASSGATSSGSIATIPTEEFANEPNVQTAPASAVTPTGNDLASKGGEAPKVNGGGNPMREAILQKLSAHYQSIKEESPRTSLAGKVDPVRSPEVQQKTQTIAPQANRPGLAPNGDPKLWDIQYELQKKGYKIKADGLNGPATEKAAMMAGMIHDTTQDTANPTAASGGFDIGHTIGSGIGWIETAWRNLKQGFSAGKAGLEEAGEEVQQQDLGNGFVLTSIEAFGSTRPAVLDTQSNTYFILNKTETGSAIARTPAPYLTIKDGQTGASMGGPMTNAAMKKAGLIKEASGEKKTMSRAAKGHEKYGKEGMQALAKAGREGKDLDKVREKYNKYD